MTIPRQSRIGLEYLSSMTILPSTILWRAPRSSSMRLEVASLSTERLVPSYAPVASTCSRSALILSSGQSDQNRLYLGWRGTHSWALISFARS